MSMERVEVKTVYDRGYRVKIERIEVYDVTITTPAGRRLPEARVPGSLAAAESVAGRVVDRELHISPVIRAVEEAAIIEKQLKDDQAEADAEAMYTQR